jgi:hypothetical protein
MGDEIRRRFQEVFGADEWIRRFASVEAMWDGLHHKLGALALPWSRTRLFQDGLPVCGHERKIVEELATKGSHNHKILLALIEKGATLMGTERAELLVKEYRRIQRLVQVSREGAPDGLLEELRREGDQSLRDRDAFIAERIDTSLEEGETGILFLGLLHRVDELLEGRFEVRHVIHSLPFGADPWQKLKERCGYGE